MKNNKGSIFVLVLILSLVVIFFGCCTTKVDTGGYVMQVMGQGDIPDHIYEGITQLHNGYRLNTYVIYKGNKIYDNIVPASNLNPIDIINHRKIAQDVLNNAIAADKTLDSLNKK